MVDDDCLAGNLLPMNGTSLFGRQGYTCAIELTTAV